MRPSPTLQLLPLRHLRPNKRNPRTHSKKQIHQLANSIRNFGFTCPIVVDEHGNVIAGHGRFEAAKLLGLQCVPTITATGLDDAQKRALALADNRIAQSAGWDREKMHMSEMRDRLAQAADIARIAETCAEGGNMQKAIEIALDVEQLIYEVNTFLNAASMMHRLHKG